MRGGRSGVTCGFESSEGDGDGGGGGGGQGQCDYHQLAD